MGWLLFTDHELHVLTNTENDFFRERERETEREDFMLALTVNMLMLLPFKSIYELTSSWYKLGASDIKLVITIYWVLFVFS